jgi:prefoldin subunit 5
MVFHRGCRWAVDMLEDRIEYRSRKRRKLVHELAELTVEIAEKQQRAFI